MPYSRSPINSYINVYTTILEEIAYIQLIPSIYRANAYSYFDLVFAQAYNT
jgi:hypothetical protein